MELRDEDAERIRRSVKPEHFEAAIKRVKWLAQNAEPGNWASNELEERWGFTFDYTEADAGDDSRQQQQ
jgi:hypothetical protein